MELNLIYIAIVIGVILVSMTLHEAMHAFVGYWLGDDTAKAQGRLTLNPIKHIDPFLTLLLPVMLALFSLPIFGAARPVPFNPERVRGGEWGAALIAIAGPLTNLLIAFIVCGFGVVFGVITPQGIEATLVGTIVLTVISVNLGFFVFNMLPLPPLDGSRVLYALAPDFIRRGMEMIERSGVFLIFIIVVLFSSVIGEIMSELITRIFELFMVIFRL